MKWWIQHAIIGTALAGCVQQDATQPTIETTEQTTCPGPNNFPKVDPLTTTKFQGVLPKVESWQVLLTTPDPNVDGQSIVMVADTTYGKITYAALFATKDLAWVHSAGPDHPWLDIVRTPPVPHPIGNRWFASFILERVNIHLQADAMAAANVTAIKIPE